MIEVELVVGATYRQKVDSKQGYEDWEYTGNTKDTPMGIWYAFKNDLGVYWFDKEDLKDFKRDTKFFHTAKDRIGKRLKQESFWR